MLGQESIRSIDRKSIAEIKNNTHNGNPVNPVTYPTMAISKRQNVELEKTFADFRARETNSIDEHETLHQIRVPLSVYLFICLAVLAV